MQGNPTVTFNGTWAAAPSCTVVPVTLNGSSPVHAVVTTTTTVQFYVASTSASTKYAINCLGVS
jgi:hypothetical protein